VFAPEYRRTVLEVNGAPREFSLHDYALRLWREQSGRSDAIPDVLVSAAELPIEAHLAMEAALQGFVDNSISKTVQVPQETQFTDFAPIYRLAYDKGLKGCTTFRPTAPRDTVLAAVPKPNPLCRSGECE
jgi:ribonucleoside-diphosphate reductase alpha chain